LVAIGCATGDEAGLDDAADFGPGGPGTPTEVSATDGVDTSGSSVSNTGSSNSNSNTGTTNSSTADSADTVPDPDCEDGDGDDYGPGCDAGEDCDDANPDINPGVPETCDGVDENCDDMIDNGCECPDDGVSGNCNMPTDEGMLAVGESKLGVVGNVPSEDAIDWYVVHFPAPMRPGEGTPTIQFAINEGEAFVFDVVTAQCEAAGQACTSGGTGGAAIGLTTWTFVDDDPGCCTPPMDSLVPWPNDLYLRVYRTTTGASCAAYQLQFSR
jgi:hypothetical protein